MTLPPDPNVIRQAAREQGQDLFRVVQPGASREVDGYDVSYCPACGEPIDYCQGHGPTGDSRGAQILWQHDGGDHTDCHPDGCDLSGEREDDIT